MIKTLLHSVMAVAVVAAPLAHAQTKSVDPYTQGAKTAKPDPYLDGAKTGKPDTFTDGAKSGKFDSYTEGARQPTASSLAPGKTADPFTDGARARLIPTPMARKVRDSLPMR